MASSLPGVVQAGVLALETLEVLETSEALELEALELESYSQRSLAGRLCALEAWDVQEAWEVLRRETLQYLSRLLTGLCHEASILTGFSVSALRCRLLDLSQIAHKSVASALRGPSRGPVHPFVEVVLPLCLLGSDPLHLGCVQGRRCPWSQSAQEQHTIQGSSCVASLVLVVRRHM